MRTTDIQRFSTTVQFYPWIPRYPYQRSRFPKEIRAGVRRNNAVIYTNGGCEIASVEFSFALFCKFYLLSDRKHEIITSMYCLLEKYTQITYLISEKARKSKSWSEYSSLHNLLLIISLIIKTESIRTIKIISIYYISENYTIIQITYLIFGNRREEINLETDDSWRSLFLLIIR